MNITDSSNTNLGLFQAGLISPYIAGAVRLLKCPTDNFVSPAQQRAGWPPRLRSYSLNAYVGRSHDSGTAPYGAWQMQKLSDVRRPSTTLLMIEVHPDSLWMPWYLISIDRTFGQWWWLPGSFHNRAGTCSSPRFWASGTSS